MNNVVKSCGDNELYGLEALAKINAILQCPFDGRGIEEDPLGYINLLQNAFLYLSDIYGELGTNRLDLLKLCKEHNIDTSKLTKAFDEEI